jgi:hypothetical protein
VVNNFENMLGAVKLIHAALLDVRFLVASFNEEQAADRAEHRIGERITDRDSLGPHAGDHRAGPQLHCRVGVGEPGTDVAAEAGHDHVPRP